MNKNKNVFINLIALGFVLAVMVVAYYSKEQDITYEISSRIDAETKLLPGETIIQPYFPNRKRIKSFSFELPNETSVVGEYLLKVSYSENIEDSGVYEISNVYRGECVKELRFTLPETFTARGDGRLYLILSSKDSNSDTLVLSADSSYASYYVTNTNSEKMLGKLTLGVSVTSEKNHKWFMLFYIFVHTIGLTLLLKYFFKGEFEDMLGISVIISIMIIYLFGIIGILSASITFIYFLSGIGFVLFFYECIRDKVNFIHKCEFQSALWIITVIILFLFVKHNYIGDPDSTFYISKSKYMFWSDSLAFSQGYAFFLPAYAYMLESLNGVFTEDIFLLSVKIYEFSMLFSFIRYIRAGRKSYDWINQSIVLIICVVLAIGIKPEAYLTAVMDVPFAITVAYLIGSIYGDKKNKDIMLFFSAIAACMIKRAGLPLIIIVFLLLIIHVFKGKVQALNKDMSKIAKPLALLICCVFVLGIVELYTQNATLTISESNNPSYIADEVTDEIILNGNKDIIVIMKLVEAFFSVRIYHGLSYAGVLGGMFVFAALVWLFVKNEKAFSFFYNQLEIIFAAVLYYGIISFKYLVGIEESGRYILNAYDRYAIHFIGGAIIYEVIAGASIIVACNGHKTDIRTTVTLITLMIIVAMNTPFEGLQNWISHDMVLIEENDEDLKKVLTLYMGKNICMYCAEGCFDEKGYYRTNMILNSWPNIITDVNVSIREKEEKDEFVKYLYDNEDYLYLVNYDHYFEENCIDIFEGEEKNIIRHSMYYIEKKTDGQISLVYLGKVPLNDAILRTLDGA